MYLKRFPVAVAFLFSAEAALAQADISPEAAFGSRESIEQISLSPDGAKIAYLAPAPGAVTVLMVADADGTSAAKPVMRTSADTGRFYWCDWASNSRLICGIYGIGNAGYGFLSSFTRLVALDADGGNVRQLGQRASDALYARQFDGGVIDWHADDNGSVLMSRAYVPERSTGTRLANSAEGLGVDLIDTRSLRTNRIEAPREEVTDYLSDGDGNIRVMEVSDQRDESGMLTGITRYQYRKAGSREWLLFSEHSEAKPGLLPVAVDAKSDSVFAYARKDGRAALYRVKLDGSLQSELVLDDGNVDVDDVVRIGRRGRVIGAEVVTDRRRIVYFDPEYKKLGQSLSKALPGLPLIQFVGANRDESRVLIFAGSDVDPGRYYIYDKAKRALNEIALVRPGLEKAALAPVKAVSFPAADGTMIPGYLTVPEGSAGKNLPAIVMPHGGPASRDEWGFDWWAQYYAARGFAVLQPNFRGSAGYGQSWFVENGFKSWRTAIGDVNDGGRWLVKQGIADAKKLAIVGWSYGGYAALQSNVLDPELFKAIVAVAPVTDLRMIIDEARNFTNSALVARYVGSGPHLEEGSPLQNVARIKAPVLMFSGDKDLNVDIRHARAMDKALNAAGKKSRFVEYEGLDHGLIDSPARIDMLKQSDAFLRASLGL